MGWERANSGNGSRQSLAAIVQDGISGQPSASAGRELLRPRTGALRRIPADERIEPALGQADGVLAIAGGRHPVGRYRPGEFVVVGGVRPSSAAAAWMGRERANSGNGLRQSLAAIVQDGIFGQLRAFSRSGVAAPEDGRTPLNPADERIEPASGKADGVIAIARGCHPVGRYRPGESVVT